MTPADRDPSRETPDGLAQCPIPMTHRRLKHVHLLWHQCLDAYHDRERFLANLSATIEALKDVTFVAQKEKLAFEDFDAWYMPRQEILKADATPYWLNNQARVTIVHHGDLESSSPDEVQMTGKNLPERAIYDDWIDRCYPMDRPTRKHDATESLERDLRYAVEQFRNNSWHKVSSIASSRRLFLQ